MGRYSRGQSSLLQARRTVMSTRTNSLKNSGSPGSSRSSQGGSKYTDAFPDPPPNKEFPTQKAKILTIDGGGTRGLITVQALRRLQREIGDTPVADYFDLIGGTSTGAILAVALVYFKIHPEKIPATVQGQSIGEKIINYIQEIYLTLSKRIFPHSWAWSFVPGVLPGDTNALESFLKEYFAEDLIESLGHKVFVTTLRNNYQPFVIRSYKYPNGSDSLFGQNPIYECGGPEVKKGDKVTQAPWKIWQALRATSAAPTYLHPYERDHVGNLPGKPKDFFTDGGQWANNPTMVALQEAHSIFGRNVDLELIFSMGTGMLIQKPSAEKDSEAERPSFTTIGSAIAHVKFASKLSLDTYYIHKHVQFYMKSMYLEEWKIRLRRFAAKGNLPFLDDLDASDDKTLNEFIKFGTNQAEKDKDDSVQFNNLPRATPRSTPQGTPRSKK